MKSTAILAALIGSSAVTALEPRLAGTSEVVMTRTVTVTTFQQAGPTDGSMLANRDVHGNKGNKGKGPARGPAAASPRESMPSFHSVAQEVPRTEPTQRINVRGPMPMVVIPTPSAASSVGMPIAQNDDHGYASPSSHTIGSKPHNGTFNLMHVTNHTADHGKGKPQSKPHNDKEDLKEWVKNLEGTVSEKAKDLEDSALSKAKDMLNEVR
ncbi:hypothetical protein N0V82_005396 [Gnomoniopsis sp. IMI 355080]|nr:hypothetical protein N0V82_005396 [Gnomoniopsis sp. IMI 355080]